MVYVLCLRCEHDLILKPSRNFEVYSFMPVCLAAMRCDVMWCDLFYNTLSVLSVASLRFSLACLNWRVVHTSNVVYWKQNVRYFGVTVIHELKLMLNNVFFCVFSIFMFCSFSQKKNNNESLVHISSLINALALILSLSSRDFNVTKFRK